MSKDSLKTQMLTALAPASARTSVQTSARSSARTSAPAFAPAVVTDRTAAPLYRTLQRSFTRALAEGRWKSGQALPSESRLAEQYGVSIGTVRRAIDELVAERILLRQQGRGTFVAAHTPDRLLFHFFHVVARAGRSGIRAGHSSADMRQPAGVVRELPSTRLRSFRHGTADAEVARALAVRTGARILSIDNLLELGGRPVIHDQIRISAAMFPGLDRKRFETRNGTIYGLYQQHYGINVVRSSERLSALPCPAAIARSLGLRAGHPVLNIRRVAYTYADRPVESRVSWVDTREHEYLSDLWKNEQDAGR